MLNWIKKSFKRKGTKARDAKGTASKKRVSKRRAGSDKRPRSASNAARNKAVILSRGEHGISRDNIDDHALKVLYRLHKAGYQACLVGGAVRDLLLGITPKDFDVATDATPEEVNKLFRNCRLIGRRFRLAHIHFGRQIIEVATYRAAHESSQSGHQDENGRIVRDNVFGELADDVWRRDFTANALYYDISDFSVIDFVGGFEDIKQKRLHLIGDAETRYREDPVRMLRALRFSAKLDFDIDEESRLPIYSLGYLLEDIPAARLYEEVLKLFHSGHAVRCFELLQEFDLLKYLFPQAAKLIAQDENIQGMLSIAMNNTDNRIKNDMRVTPAFLFAALLWHPVNSRVKEYVDGGMPYSVAIQKVATKVLSQQSGSVSIPRRFTTTMRDIWGLQTRFHYRAGKRALAVLEHPKFRAGYDFLCIRAQSGEEIADGDIKQDCQWWTDIQKQNAEQQKKTLFSTSGKSRSGKPKKRRRSSAKKKVKDPES
ncbi:MAG: polynucleotide adenylyltransferase PcnB [Gammaproteobacteria bacterium]|nr:polynucleotide adenylyltransferase PcnB [Gammaproteobacteria bacterium]